MGGWEDKIQPKKQNKKRKQIKKETGSKAVSIDTTVETINPRCRTYKKPFELQLLLPPTLRTSKVMQSRLHLEKKPSNKPQ